MPAISPADLVDAIIDAIEQSGYAVILVGSARTHPRRFILTDREGTTYSVWIYAWTLTPGGRPSLPDEYRIQMTTVSSPLHFNPDGATALIGFEPNLGLFAGFDLQRHRRFTKGSPSVQIDIRKVREALDDGLTFDRKDNEEIAVGIRPDQLVNYMLNADHLHRYGAQPRMLRLLTKAMELQPISEAEVQALPEARRQIVQVVRRLSRKANFRQQVLTAYANRCAVTRAQLRLVDAAHIVPVGTPESADHVTNGIALSPTYHRAYDNGLIYLDESYVMNFNEAKGHELAGLRLDGGLVEFRASLGRVHLPPDPRQWPKQEFIRKANAVRRIGT